MKLNNKIAPVTGSTSGIGALTSPGRSRREPVHRYPVTTAHLRGGEDRGGLLTLCGSHEKEEVT